MSTTENSSNAYQIVEGKDCRVAVVASRFNAEICDPLLEAAVQALKDCGVSEENISIYRVPGAFEMPLALQGIANLEHYDAAVALGCVIRGETPHFDYVCGETARGVMDVSLKTGLPIGFGLLTTENQEQARARAGGPLGNKGAEAALAALEMAGLLKSIEKER
jgi:6,7-dimethyl-8-ribityllumazine synthase